jgi:glycosyltransferase involved in cell wall biosynthesis
LQEKPNDKFRIIETPSCNAIELFKEKFHLNPKRSFQEQMGIPSIIRKRKKSFSTKIVKMFEAVISYPDIESGWAPFALAAAEEIIKSEKIDAMISVWPITANIIAERLYKKHNIPWIADFPDLWAYTYAYSYGFIRRLFDIRLEKKTLKRATVLTTSSYPQEEILRKMHIGKPVQTILIGFNPDKVNEPPAELTKLFSITYTGVFYGKERNPSKFLIALSQLLSEGLMDSCDIEVRFFGPKEDWIEREIVQYNLEGIVKQYGNVPWAECLGKQYASQLLLHLNWENKKEKGAYSGKISEYLAARRPVLSVGGWGNDVIEELFTETSVGDYCPQVEDVKKSLLRYYVEYKETGKVSFRGDVDKINRHSYQAMAKKFSEILNGISSNL